MATADERLGSAPDLSEDQAKVLDLIVRVFREHAAWPSWEFVDKTVARDGIELETTLREMPFGLVYPDPRASGWFYQPAEKLAVTFEGLLRSRKAGQEVNYFVHALRYIAQRETESVPSTPSETTHLVVTSDEIREAIGGTEADVKKLLLLIRGERFIAALLNDDGTRWSLRPAREVRVFVDLADAQAYVDIKVRLLSGDLPPPLEAQQTMQTEDPVTPRGAPAPERVAVVASLVLLGAAWLYAFVADGETWILVSIALAIGVVFLLAALVAFPERGERGRKANTNLLGAALGVPSLLLGLVALDGGGERDEGNLSPQVLRVALIRPEDLPDGWDYIPEGDVSGPRGIAAEHYCGEVTEVVPTEEVYTALAEAPQFLGLRDSVFSTVAEFPSGDADDFMREIAGSARCGEWQPGGDGLTYEVEAVPELAREIGRDVIWLELSNRGGGGQTAVHVYIRVEDLVAHLAYNVPEPGEPSADPVTIARRQADRMENLLDSL